MLFGVAVPETKKEKNNESKNYFGLEYAVVYTSYYRSAVGHDVVVRKTTLGKQKTYGIFPGIYSVKDFTVFSHSS